MSAVICRHLVVQGTVQGVGFRASTLREATRIGGLRGWVRNLPNGDVEILVQGDEAKVKTLVEWSAYGPPSAAVKNVEMAVAAIDPTLSPFAVAR